MITFCPLVNPLCPDDLCRLPLNHEGSSEGIHLLNTFPEPAAVHEVMFMMLGATTKEDLVAAGASFQRALGEEED